MNNKIIISSVLSAVLALGPTSMTTFSSEAETETDEGTYVLMNIPYNYFYEAEVNNEVPVDAVTSATMQKSRASTIVSGSYHTDSAGSNITGVIYPVKVSDISVLEGQNEITDDASVSVTTTIKGETSTVEYTGSDALFEAPSYSYYVLSDTPAAYKELTVDEEGTWTFGEVVGPTSAVDATITLDTEGSHVDYELTLEGLPEDLSSVSGVVLVTSEGDSYGLRHLENIFKSPSEIGFNLGVLAQSHGNPLSSDHYRAIQGKTLTEVKYYTQEGTYTVETDLYIPYKTSVSATVEGAEVSAGQTSVTLDSDLPDDFEAQYSVEGLADATVEDGTLTYSTDAFGGTYTLTIADGSGKYASVVTDFVLTTADVVAAYNEDSSAPALVAAEGASDEALSAYIANLSGCTINDTEYSFGKHGIDLIDAEGAINLEVEGDEGEIFAESGSYEITINATGYDTPVSFTLVID